MASDIFRLIPRFVSTFVCRSFFKALVSERESESLADGHDGQTQEATENERCVPQLQGAQDQVRQD